MDIGIDIECLRCGLHFSHSFRGLPHGRVLKCPFCSSTAIELKGDLPLEGRRPDGFCGGSTRFSFERIKDEHGN
ncbi:MAG: hypothetical protein ACE5GY_02825 [Thermodesulfobacteriota bacterium]